MTILAVDWFNIAGDLMILAIIGIGCIVLVRTARTAGDRRVALGRGVVTVAIVLAVIALIGYNDGGDASIAFDDWAYTNVAAAIGIGIVAFLALPRAGGNGAVWALVGSALFSSLQAFGAALALTDGISNGAVQAGTVTVAPADVSLAAAIGVNLALWCWLPALFLITIYGLLLFPDGSVPSPRWRVVGWVSGVTLVIASGVTMWMFRPSQTIPYAEIQETSDLIIGVAMLILFTASLLSIVAAVIRWRRSEGEERLQFRWAAGGLILLALAGIVTMPIDTDAFRVASLVVVPIVFVAYGIAITKYRLYDIDVVINRSIVFGLLAVFITVTYAVVVVTIGSLIGGSDVVLAVVATAIVAIVFEPVRDRAQRFANRLVYGQRAAPYEVLSELTKSLAHAEEETGLLDRMARRLRAGTGAESAQVWLVTDHGIICSASDPPTPTTALRGLADLEGVVVPIEHDGHVLGALSVSPASGAQLRPAELRLAEDLAGSAALVVTKLRLDTDLERTATELASSRRRLVEAQDVELRRFERQLQEGAIQDILGLKVATTLAARSARDEGSHRTADLLTGLADEVQGAIDEIHGLATGLYPALLEAEGLDSAIRAMATGAPVPVTVTGAAGPLRRDVELTVFYCISEAITNAMKYAYPPVAITLTQEPTAFEFTIADSGPGFDLGHTKRRSGLLNMTDRLDTIGGTLTIHTAPHTHTTITGTIPTQKERGEIAAGVAGGDQSSAAFSESGPKSDLEMKATAPASSAGRS